MLQHNKLRDHFLMERITHNTGCSGTHFINSNFLEKCTQIHGVSCIIIYKVKMHIEQHCKIIYELHF